MIKYLQPNFYHFSQDPILLAQFASERINNSFSNRNFNLIDMCCGCGVSGLEMIQRLPSVRSRLKKVIFIEKQLEFLSFIEKNINNFKVDQTPVEIFINSLPHLDSAEITFLICNPPFYIDGQGRKSGNNQKDQCSFMEQGQAKKIIDWMVEIKKVLDGEFFFMFILPINSFWLEMFRETNFQIKVNKLSEFPQREIISNIY
ncbi:methyltransferase [Bacteriovoracaceae bacterium]|nr:methyltransferase [Bacteriovoracaceae bacterium]